MARRPNGGVRRQKSNRAFSSQAEPGALAVTLRGGRQLHSP
jgi:hypothetical protein